MASVLSRWLLPAVESFPEAGAEVGSDGLEGLDSELVMLGMSTPPDARSRDDVSVR